jgi:nucleoside-diphosphate-sugar epimerase
MPPADLYPVAVKVVLRDLDTTTDEELLSLLHGHEVLVFAAGMDDRYTPKKPAYPKFHHANVEVPVRIVRLAKQAGVKRAMVFGSYFSHFHRLWPEMKLAEGHSYIRSRMEQETAVTSLPGLDVDVLELPYIFGDLLGRKPLWYPLVKYIRAAPLVFYMCAGTASITAKTVGKAAFSVIERGHASTCYPIGQENLTWTHMLTRLARADGRMIRVVRLPSWFINIGMFGVLLIQKLQRKEGGLNLSHFVQLQTAETYLDPQPSQKALGDQTGGLDEAFQETVEACKS